MVKGLSFLSTSKLWRSLLLKTFLFGLGLFGVYFFGFSFSALFVFSFLIFGIYFSQLPERGYLRISFPIFVLTALSALHFLGGSFYLALFACLFFSFLFYLLLGLTAPIFKNRQSVYLFFNTGLFLAVFLLFFGADKSKHFLAINLLLFLVIFLLFKECFKFLQSAVHNSQFIALVLAFLGLELFWVISLLPVGFINLAILQTLFIFLTRDFTLAYFSGGLNQRFFIYHSLIFIILVSLIFVTSNWSI